MSSSGGWIEKSKVREEHIKEKSGPKVAHFCIASFQ